MARALLFATLLVPALSGCGGECSAAESAQVCPDEADAGPSVSAREWALVGSLVEEARAGVVPFDEHGVGICIGDRGCGTWMGRDAGVLPPGKYAVQASLRVPRVGPTGTWKVTYRSNCAVTRDGPSGPTTRERGFERTYDVSFAGEDRGYPLSPLQQIHSPRPDGGRAECTWALVAHHPAGDTEYTGSWTTEAAD